MRVFGPGLRVLGAYLLVGENDVHGGIHGVRERHAGPVEPVGQLRETHTPRPQPDPRHEREAQAGRSLHVRRERDTPRHYRAGGVTRMRAPFHGPRPLPLHVSPAKPSSQKLSAQEELSTNEGPALPSGRRAEALREQEEARGGGSTWACLVDLAAWAFALTRGRHDACGARTRRAVSPCPRLRSKRTLRPQQKT